MPVWTCAECGSRSTHGGDCITCGRSLGSPKKAVLAAAVATAALSLLWIGSGLLLQIQFSLFALLYGALISGAVVQISGGRGALYQLIATSFTLAGMLCSETLLILLLWETLARDQGLEWESPGFLATLQYLASYDAGTIAYSVFGLFGGFWVWQQPSQ